MHIAPEWNELVSWALRRSKENNFFYRTIVFELKFIGVTDRYHVFQEKISKNEGLGNEIPYTSSIRERRPPVSSFDW